MPKRYIGIIGLARGLLNSTKNSSIGSVGPVSSSGITPLKLSTMTPIHTYSPEKHNKKTQYTGLDAFLAKEKFVDYGRSSWAFAKSKQKDKVTNDLYSSDREVFLQPPEDIKNFIREEISPGSLNTDLYIIHNPPPLLEFCYQAILRNDKEVLESELFVEILKSDEYRQQLLNFSASVKSWTFFDILFKQGTVSSIDITNALIIAIANEGRQEKGRYDYDYISYELFFNFLLREFKEQNNGSLKVLNTNESHNLLYVAMMCDNIRGMQWLLENGIDPNGFMTEKGNLLHIAIEYKMDSFARALIEHGIDLKAVNSQNELPFDLATKYERKHVIEYITEAVEDEIGGFSDNTQDDLLPHELVKPLFSKKNLAPVLGCKVGEILKIDQSKNSVNIHFNRSDESAAKNAALALIKQGIIKPPRYSTKFFIPRRIEIRGKASVDLLQKLVNSGPLTDMKPDSFQPL